MRKGNHHLILLLTAIAILFSFLPLFLRISFSTGIIAYLYIAWDEFQYRRKVTKINETK
ncbi:hypothetical protein [Enterococcus faecium]|uniref:hypothetical protein n=1 Tax=Enterococcus faecium TaxID=1352 RepID=UPI0002A2CC6D|nr:hypothetical protein [Enterococcus faecium]ELA55053.1 hypothetical protein OGC_03811 [Enterococcus faecium EnGen0010]EME8134643.1 hypothetical protein [Enterococcus faecium]EMF0602427.1 hypothetical protein [Enterococcus faecium]RBS38715.1 hypothetical protein EB19_02268 [Enterococcus faecium]RBS54382.1 hypothetical protein EB33_02372 [Enterococcus faecium]